jgi:prepilin-type N-terminal cleavage/methylation domain-containing protein
MKRLRKLLNQKGLSMLEVMISMGILSISLLMLLNMAMVALDANDWSNKATMSTQLIQDKLEEIRTGLNMDDGIDTVNNVERVWTVDSVGSHLRRVNIVTSWENNRGDTLQNSIRTFVRTNTL